MMQLLQQATEPHIGSFDYMLEEALPRAVVGTVDMASHSRALTRMPGLDTIPMKIDGREITLWIKDVRIGEPITCACMANNVQVSRQSRQSEAEPS